MEVVMGIFDKLDQLSDQIAKSVNEGFDPFMGESATRETADDAASETPKTIESQSSLEKVSADDDYYKQFRTEDLVCEIEGNRGRHLFVYDNRCLIIVRPTVGSVLTGNATDGEKTIFYKDCIGIQFKESRFAIGYLQVETASGIGNNGKSNFFNENTFTFEDKNVFKEDKNDDARGTSQLLTNTVSQKGEITYESQTTNEYMRAVANYIIEKVAQYKTSCYSTADEIKKYKELLDAGTISQEEFDAKKKHLLGL